MLITYHGHSEFLIETAKGIRVLFDPFPAEVTGFPMHRVKADIVAISHHHFDHDYVDKVDGKPLVIDQSGRHTPLAGLTLTGTPAWHDEEGGRKRGQVLCFLLETEGLRVLHLGDLFVGEHRRAIAQVPGPDASQRRQPALGPGPDDDVVLVRRVRVHARAARAHKGIEDLQAVDAVPEQAGVRGVEPGGAERVAGHDRAQLRVLFDRADIGVKPQ